MDHEGEAVSRDDIARAVWPEHAEDPSSLTPAMLSDAIDRLRHAIEDSDSPTHIEQVGPGAYCFENTPFPD
jgi:DNA-binding winged helix-turn-helix (wHTH) protein